MPTAQRQLKCVPIERIAKPSQGTFGILRFDLPPGLPSYFTSLKCYVAPNYTSAIAGEQRPIPLLFTNSYKSHHGFIVESAWKAPSIQLATACRTTWHTSRLSGHLNNACNRSSRNNSMHPPRHNPTDAKPAATAYQSIPIPFSGQIIPQKLHGSRPAAIDTACQERATKPEALS